MPPILFTMWAISFQKDSSWLVIIVIFCNIWAIICLTYIGHDYAIPITNSTRSEITGTNYKWRNEKVQELFNLDTKLFSYSLETIRGINFMKLAYFSKRNIAGLVFLLILLIPTNALIFLLFFQGFPEWAAWVTGICSTLLPGIGAAGFLEGFYKNYYV